MANSHLCVCVCLKRGMYSGGLWPIEQLPWEVLSASSPLVYMLENHVAQQFSFQFVFVFMRFFKIVENS
jgi:hypothetical protein